MFPSGTISRAEASNSGGKAMPHIHVIHENAAWLEPLAAALDRQKLPWCDWFVDRGVFDLSRPPPDGVFYNRMSASSHTRGHRYAAELTASVLAWLERYGRRVVNGGRALDLEISKARQYAALEASGIRTPETVLVAGKELLVDAARRGFGSGPFILKPNRGGKGLGVRLFQSPDALADHLAGPDYEPPIDGLHLLQQYIRAPAALITRAEFIGGRFMYAVEVDTSDGFELCPADVCSVGDAFCPAGPEEVGASRAKFTITDDIEATLKRRYESFLAAIASRSPGSSSSPTSAALSIPTTSTPTPTTTPRRKPEPAALAWRLSPVFSAPNSPALPVAKLKRCRMG
jgi:hypothetical protein